MIEIDILLIYLHVSINVFLLEFTAPLMQHTVFHAHCLKVTIFIKNRMNNFLNEENIGF